MTGRSVLVDTAAWLAVFHRRDQYHLAAAAEFRPLRAERIPLVVTDLILAEVHLHLLHGLGIGRAGDRLSLLLEDPLIEQVFADRRLQEAALHDWIGPSTDQPFTLTDAVSFAVMRARDIRAAFTFDRHFSVAGFQCLPS